MTPDRLREIRFALALLVAPLLLVGAVELAFGSVGSSEKRQVFDWAALREATMVDPEDRFSLFRPGSAWGNLEFNSHGFRSPEIDADKPAGTIRLAFLGDSVTMTAELPEAQTLPATVKRLLSEKYPSCRFDYLTFAGPSYTTAFVAGHWPSIQARFSPDVAVVFLGSPLEVVSRITPEEDATAQNSGWDWYRELALFKKLRHHQQRLSFDQFLPAMAVAPAGEAAIDAALQEMRAALASMTVKDGTVLVGHRGRIRDTGSMLDQMTQTSRLRRKLGNDSPIAADELLSRTLTALADAVRGAGGRFSDAQTRVPPDDVHYLDAVHLSATGAQALAEAVLPDIEALLPGCGQNRSGS